MRHRIDDYVEAGILVAKSFYYFSDTKEVIIDFPKVPGPHYMFKTISSLIEDGISILYCKRADFVGKPRANVFNCDFTIYEIIKRLEIWDVFIPVRDQFDTCYLLRLGDNKLFNSPSGAACDRKENERSRTSGPLHIKLASGEHLNLKTLWENHVRETTDRIIKEEQLKQQVVLEAPEKKLSPMERLLDACKEAQDNIFVTLKQFKWDERYTESTAMLIGPDIIDAVSLEVLLSKYIQKTAML